LGFVISDAPCKDCVDRKLRCHSSCEKYQAFKERNQKRLDEQHKQAEETAARVARKRRFQNYIRKETIPDSSFKRIKKI